MKAWKRYVGKVARRYGSSVDYQIWNEPNVIQFWNGSVRQMAQLTVAASKKITGVAGKKARIVAPSFPLRLESQRRWFKKYWAQNVGGRSIAAYVDVVSVNLYPQAGQAPEAQLPLLKFAKRALPRAARGKPIWNTEINYGLIDGSTPAKEISEAKQAAFVARTYALNAGANIGRVYWYRWKVGAIANTHLVEDDGTTLTRAGRAHQVVHGWLVGTSAKSCTKARRGPAEGVYTCTLRESRREVRRIYWKPAGSEVRIRTPKTTLKWTDLSGDVTRKKGSFRLRVGQTPLMVTSRR